MYNYRIVAGVSRAAGTDGKRRAQNGCGQNRGLGRRCASQNRDVMPRGVA